MKLPDNVCLYVQNLISKYSEIRSIWLMGSRANNAARPNSDWDILVFGNESILNSLKAEDRPESDIDLFIVYDGNDFECPWLRESDKARKRGNLKNWKWKVIDPEYAEYEAAKEMPNQIFPRVRIEKAKRIFFRK